MPLISIVIPVYNAELYLTQCIESVLAQTVSDFELLLVDDGSSDNSVSICERYAESDPRVKVFRNAHGGVSRARNRGMDEASGKYLCFADADDWMEPDYFADFLRFPVSLPGVLVSQPVLWDSPQKKELLQEHKEGEGKLGDPDWAVRSSLLFNGYCYSKLYDLAWVRKWNIRFPEKIPFYEDQVFVMEYLKHTEHIFLSESHPYHYMQHGTQANFTSRPRDLADHMQIAMVLAPLMEEMLDRCRITDPQYRQKLHTDFWMGLLIYYLYHFRLNECRSLARGVSRTREYIRRYFVPCSPKEARYIRNLCRLPESLLVGFLAKHFVKRLYHRLRGR